MARAEEKGFVDVNGGGDKFEINNPFRMSCETFAQSLHDFLSIAAVGHVICGFLNIYREVFEAKLGALGQFMRAMEIICVFFSLTMLIMSFEICFGYFSITENPGRQHLRNCFSNDKIMKKWTGSAIQWIIMELTVWLAFLFTLFFLILRSRCSKVGIDTSK